MKENKGNDWKALSVSQQRAGAVRQTRTLVSKKTTKGPESLWTNYCTYSSDGSCHKGTMMQLYFLITSVIHNKVSSKALYSWVFNSVVSFAVRFQLKNLILISAAWPETYYGLKSKLTDYDKHTYMAYIHLTVVLGILKMKNGWEKGFEAKWDFTTVSETTLCS